MKLRWLLTSLLVVLVGVVRASASDVEDFLKSYREAYPRLVESYNPCRVSGVMTLEVQVADPRSPAVPRRLVQQLDYLRSGEDEKLVITTRAAEIGGADQRQAFASGVVIRRGETLYAVKGPDEKGGYSLAYRGGSDLFPPRRGELNENRGRFFRPACEAPGYNLPIFLDQPALSIQSVQPLSRDGESLVRVDYTVTLTDPTPFVQRGWCLLKPERDWALREFETTYDGSTVPFSYGGVVDYEPDTATAPRPRAVHLKYTMPSFVQTIDFSYDRFEFAASAPEDFSLAEYGLAEAEYELAETMAPPAAKSRNRLPIWFAGIAAVALMLTIGLRVLIKRRDRARSGAGGGPV